MMGDQGDSPAGEPIAGDETAKPSGLPGGWEMKPKKLTSTTDPQCMVLVAIAVPMARELWEIKASKVAGRSAGRLTAGDETAKPPEIPTCSWEMKV
jgi:hypothetical protein